MAEDIIVETHKFELCILGIEGFQLFQHHSFLLLQDNNSLEAVETQGRLHFWQGYNALVLHPG